MYQMNENRTPSEPERNYPNPIRILIPDHITISHKIDSGLRLEEWSHYAAKS